MFIVKADLPSDMDRLFIEMKTTENNFNIDLIISPPIFLKV